MTDLGTAERSFAHPQSLDMIERMRKPFIPALRKAIAPLVEKISPGSHILEIGAGHGGLIPLLSAKLTTNLIQTDVYGHMAKVAKINPGAKVAVASVYELPFPDDAFDYVIGLSSFDVFTDLEKAVEETGRVTKSGGSFLHFLDCLACEDPIIQDLQKQGVPFPYVDEDGRQIGFYLVDFHSILKAASRAPENYKPILMGYIANPLNYWNLLAELPDEKKFMNLLSKLAVALTDGKGKVVLHNEYFQQKLLSILVKYGYVPTFCGQIEGVEVIDEKDLPPDLKQEKFRQIFNRSGQVEAIKDSLLNENLPPGKVLTSAAVYAVEAKKKEQEY